MRAYCHANPILEIGANFNHAYRRRPWDLREAKPNRI